MGNLTHIIEKIIVVLTVFMQYLCIQELQII